MWFPDDLTVKLSLQDFDLSQNTSFRRLRISAGSLGTASQDGNGSRLLKYVLSTVRPSIFLRVVIIYGTSTFRGVDNRRDSEWPYLRKLPRSMAEDEASEHRRRFELLREVHGVRNFGLVLCANVWDPVGEYAVRRLKEAVAAAKAEKVFDRHFPAPWVTCNPRWDPP